MTAAAALSQLRSRWRIPIVAATPPSVDVVVAPADIAGLLRALLDVLDARVSIAVALWLSLLDDIPALADDWSELDRRRVAYLAEMGRVLRLHRHEGEPSWSVPRVAGLEPSSWATAVPLFDSFAPVLPASLPGRRWGIVEVVDVADYAAFQRLFLAVTHREVA
jgi:hypothetical protein